jgi:hypothetical protein
MRECLLFLSKQLHFDPTGSDYLLQYRPSTLSLCGLEELKAGTAEDMHSGCRTETPALYQIAQGLARPDGCRQLVAIAAAPARVLQAQQVEGGYLLGRQALRYASHQPFQAIRAQSRRYKSPQPGPTFDG